jgi:23S rRNA (uridine2552-2'-O)-methyltransferase
VFKLEEIDQRLNLFRGVKNVVDLGAAPGSWSLYASGKVGPKGRVLAIDIKEIVQAFPPNVEVVQGDALSVTSDVLARFCPYDLVLSDMAPNTSGNKIADQLRSAELFLRAVEVAKAFGREGSSFVGKLFMSGEFESVRKTLTEAYRQVRVIRPEGTRKQSTELFLVGIGLRASVGGPAESDPENPASQY